MLQGTTFKLTVAKVNELLFQGEAISLTIPSADGILTILAHHEPLITLLKEGILIVRENDKEQTFQVEHGLCETSHGQVTVLI